MRRLESRLDVRSEAFAANSAHNRQLATRLKALQHTVRHERPKRDIDRLTRQDKLFIRDRLALLLDPGTPFLELSTLAANQAHDGEVPGAGQLCGIGVVAGREVVIPAHDASIKAGAWYPLSVTKIGRTLDIAMENRL